MPSPNITPSLDSSEASQAPRLTALQSALAALDSFMLDECPDGQNWEDFDPDVDELRTRINDLIEAG